MRKLIFLCVPLGFFAVTTFAYPVPAGCDHPQYTCTDPGATRDIEGVPVTLDCWGYHVTYTCGLAPVDQCSTFEKTCKVGGIAKCVSQIQGQCVKYQYTYECPSKVCKTHSIYCANDVFCIDGHCAKQTPTQNQDFGQSTAELAAAAKAAQDAADQKQAGGIITLFAGHKAECSYDVLGAEDCCKDSGWGNDAGLLNCSDDEKKLGKDKEHYLTSYVGTYCHNKILGQCVTKHKVYCVFDSKMARITQDYGRSQLGKSYGDPQNADCSGFSMDEFQKINFNVIDFVDPIYIYPGGGPNQAAGIAGDMSVDAPSSSDMANEINKRINDDIHNNTPSSDKSNTFDTRALSAAITKQIQEQQP